MDQGLENLETAAHFMAKSMALFQVITEQFEGTANKEDSPAFEKDIEQF